MTPPIPNSRFGFRGIGSRHLIREIGRAALLPRPMQDSKDKGTEEYSRRGVPAGKEILTDLAEILEGVLGVAQMPKTAARDVLCGVRLLENLAA